MTFAARLALVLVALPLAACSSGSVSVTASDTSGVAALRSGEAAIASRNEADKDINACGGVTVAVVHEVAGLVTPAPKITLDGTERDCEFRSAAGVVVVHLVPGAAQTAFEADRTQLATRGVPTKPLTGLAAKAYLGSAVEGSSRTASALGWAPYGEVTASVVGPVTGGPSAKAMEASATTLLRTELYYAAGVGTPPS